MEKNRVNLRICGSSYTILSEDDPEYVEGLGELIDSEMKGVSQSSPTLSTTQCAILVALDQADACKRQQHRQIISEHKSRIILRTVQGQGWKSM